jgi:S-adenosylmethionine:tRNA ribosyltransferase-isomerase
VKAAAAPAPPGYACPEGAPATEPPEARSLTRDGVRLLVAKASGLTHAHFRELRRFLRTGDLVVVNTSATLPGAVDGMRAGGAPVIVHFSADLGDGTWIVELRRADNSGPLLDGSSGEDVDLPGGSKLRLLGAYRGVEGRSRLLRARLAGEQPEGTSLDYLMRFGRPISYGYLKGRWPLDFYQTVFATEPGSAEMPSAARPFTTELVTELVARGVAVAPIVLHTGVSSPELGEPPAPEPFRVPASTAGLVNHTRQNGGRVVAVGTTVTRALESAAGADGRLEAAEGWTDLVLDGSRPARVVDGLVTGWHAAGASHLDLLESVAGDEMVRRAYLAAAGGGYLWHEFGDSCLLLPDRRPTQLR